MTSVLCSCLADRGQRLYTSCHEQRQTREHLQTPHRIQLPPTCCQPNEEGREVYRQIERQTSETSTETSTSTEGQRVKQTDGYRGRQTEGYKGRETEGQTDRQEDREADRLKDIEADRPMDRGRQVDRYAD